MQERAKLQRLDLASLSFQNMHLLRFSSQLIQPREEEGTRYTVVEIAFWTCFDDGYSEKEQDKKPEL